MRRRKILQTSALFTVGALSTTMLGSCGNQSATSTQTNTSSSPSSSPLRVAKVPWIGWSHSHVAEVKGFFVEEGIAVEQTLFQTVTEVNTALLSNQMDLAWLVAVDLLVLNAQAPDLKFIMACDYSGDVDAILGYGINGRDDLRGKTLAREDIPYEIVFVGRYLESIGLTEQDVKIVSMTVPDGTAAFVAGNVDAVATYEPFAGKGLRERSGAKILYSAKGTNVIPNGLAGHGKVIQERRDDVLAYMRAVDKAMKFAADNPEEANAIVAKWVGITPEEISAQMKQIKLLNVEDNKSIVFNPTHPLNVFNSVEAAALILQNAGKTSQTIDGATFLDDSLIKAL